MVYSPYIDLSRDIPKKFYKPLAEGRRGKFILHPTLLSNNSLDLLEESILGASLDKKYGEGQYLCLAYSDFFDIVEYDKDTPEYEFLEIDGKIKFKRIENVSGDSKSE